MTRSRTFLFLILCWPAALLTAQGPLIVSAKDSDDDSVRPFDTILLKNGNTLVGLVEGDYDAPEIPLLMNRGTGTIKIKVKREDIQQITPRQTADDVYRKRLLRFGKARDQEHRAQMEFELGLWCKSPLLELDGAPPRPKDALQHFFNAVALLPGLTEAYPHLFSSLTRQGAEGGGADLESEVRAALLAEKGGYNDPGVDYRLGKLLAEQVQLPEKAQPYLERVLQNERKNQGHLRESRTLLAAIYRRLGSPEKAISMYEATITSPETSPGNFEPYYELARLHARSGKLEDVKAARELFSKAQAIQPEYLPIQAELAALDYREGNLLQAEKTLKALLAKEPENVARAIDLALVRARLGRSGPTEKVLNAILSKAEGQDQARAYLGLAGIKADRNDTTAAVELCQKALESAPDSIEAKVFLASQLVRLSKLDEARKIAQELLAGSGDNRWLFAGGSRILGEAELAEGHTDLALASFQRAAAVDARDAPLLERVGVLFLRQGKLDLAYPYLKRARERGGDRPDTLNALAYYHYTRGELQESKKLLTQVTGLVRAPEKVQGKVGPVPPARAYALLGLDLISDIERLEVWTADLKGPDGPTLNGWEEDERFGIDIKRQDSKIVLSGKQANAADGVTLAMLQRPVDVGSFERVSMRARVESGKVRLALRLEGASSRGGASAGLIFYRDLDGTLRPQVKSTVGDWETVLPSENDSPDGGKLLFKGTAKWPEDTAAHLLEIRKARARGTALGAGLFDLYFDGEPVARNVKVTGLGGRQYQAGLSAQTDAVGNELSVSVESFRIYRERPVVRAKVIR